MNRLARKMELAGWGLRTLAKHGWPRALIHLAAGVGDELMLTAVIRALRERGAPKFWVMSRRPEIYEGNADVASILPVDPRVFALARRCRAQIVEPRYTHEGIDGNLRPAPAHIITCLMATSGVTGTVRLRSFLKLTDKEIGAAANTVGAIVLQSSVRSAGRPNELKEWWPDRWQYVADKLRHAHRVIQLGGANDPLLENVEDRRGCGLRQSAAILQQARLFVGLESGLMHLARAVDCPAVILFGGRVLPEQAGYPSNKNLVRNPICSPCWRYNGCDLDRQCMRDISSDEVLEAVSEALGSPRRPLPESTVVITQSEQARIIAALDCQE